MTNEQMADLANNAANEAIRHVQDALGASEAQAYAMDDLQENQRSVAIWQRIY